MNTRSYTHTGAQVALRHIHTATCLHKPCYQPSTSIIPSAAPGRLCGSGRALTRPGRLARSGALGIRVDAGSGPGAGGGSANRRRRRRQCVTQTRSDRFASPACRSTV